MVESRVSIVAKEVYKIRIGDKSAIWETSSSSRVIYFNPRHLKGWRTTTGTTVEISTADLEIIKDAVRKHFSNLLVWLIHGRCRFVSNESEIPDLTPLGLKVLYFFKKPRL